MTEQETLNPTYELLGLARDLTQRVTAQLDAQDAAVTAAKSLGAMRKALVEEGFTPSEAFSIVMASVESSLSK